MKHNVLWVISNIHVTLPYYYQSDLKLCEQIINKFGGYFKKCCSTKSFVMTGYSICIGVISKRRDSGVSTAVLKKWTS